MAGRQYGVVARRDLLRAGVTSRQITWRLSGGRLHEIHRGVYLVGHIVATEHGRDLAALLAFGTSAVLSHRSAAALWELLPYPATAPACVTLPIASRVVRPGIDAHRAALSPRDVRRRKQLPVTSPPRTVLDLAAELDRDDLERLVAEAHYRRLASEPELREQLENNPGKRGTKSLRKILDLAGGAKRTRSPAEREMLTLLRRAGIAGYETNARIHGFEVDVLWRGLNFAVEVDGFGAHSSRRAFERDRLKIAKLKARGLDVMPITPRQIRDDPEGVLARLRRALESAGYA
jgi:very-short-patch-repair endonuclease